MEILRYRASFSRERWEVGAMGGRWEEDVEACLGLLALVLDHGIYFCGLGGVGDMMVIILYIIIIL